LNQFVGSISFQVDGLTQIVAYQTQQTLLLFNYESHLVPHESQDSIRLFLNQESIARIVEGCNGVSVMILFTAFVFAFKGKWKHTLLFILVGILIIHILNVLRIALLCLALYHYPESEHLLHGVIFPLFIYGVVFGLWVIWVNKFSLYVTKTNK
jgi:exosortase family protein XrtF